MENIIMSPLIDNISSLMKEKGWNGKALAEHSGQKMSAIYNILSGRSNKPSADKIEAIAKAFGVTTSHILYGTPEKPDFVNPQDFDGLLYTDSTILIRDICTKRKITFQNKQEEKERLMHYAQRVYRYAKKRQEEAPDPIFAEDIIAEDEGLI